MYLYCISQGYNCRNKSIATQGMRKSWPISYSSIFNEYLILNIAPRMKWRKKTSKRGWGAEIRASKSCNLSCNIVALQSCGVNVARFTTLYNHKILCSRSRSSFYTLKQWTFVARKISCATCNATRLLDRQLVFFARITAPLRIV